MAAAHRAILRMADGTARHSCNTGTRLHERVWLGHFKHRVRKGTFAVNLDVAQLYLYTSASRCPSSRTRCTGGAGPPVAQILPRSEMHRSCSTGSSRGFGSIPRVHWRGVSKRHTQPLGIQKSTVSFTEERFVTSCCTGAYTRARKLPLKGGSRKSHIVLGDTHTRNNALTLCSSF